MNYLKQLSLFLLIIFLTACAVGPDFHTPPLPCVSRYTENPLPRQTVSTNIHGGASQRYTCEDIPAAWWTLFRSPTLNQLICRGIQNSPNLEAAKAALRQAHENVNVQIGTLLIPNVSGQFTGTRQRFSEDAIGLPGNVSETFNLFNTTVNVSYTPDVFGGNRRQVESFVALEDFERFELEAAYLTLTANITTAAITEASLRAQIQATHDIIKLQRDILRIVKTQFGLGAVSAVEVATQETQLAQTEVLLPVLEKNLAQIRHQLAVLVGSFPCACLPQFDLNALHLPEKLPVTLPARLVCQRPDVRAAEALLHQASAQIGVATANLLPQFPLTANYGSEAINIAHLFTSPTQVWLLSGQALQPIFRGGALFAARRGAIAAYDQAFAQYKQAVLQAFQNVADALRATETDARTLKDQTAAEKAAYKLLVLTKGQFYLGATDYLSLLNAQQQYQRARVLRIQAQTARFADTAALFQALGGGWWNRQCRLG